MDIEEKYQSLFQCHVLPLKNVQKAVSRYSYTILFGEYQTRLYQWKKALGQHDLYLFNKDKSFHNLFLDISPPWLDSSIPEVRVIADLENAGFPGVSTHHRHYYGFFISMYLNWELFKHCPELERFKDLPHPYETVYTMFFRGANIFNGERIFDICNKSYIQHDGTFKSPSLNSNFLDFVDSEMGKGRPPRNLPEQEKIDQLWDAFNKSNIA